jgi:HEPN domain-containing protein
MAQQTAVEMYHYKIKSIMGNWTPQMIEIFEQTFEQAKQMEKDWIIHTYWVAYKEGRYSGDKTAEEYYNETYGTTS